MVHIASPADARRVRSEIIDYFWGGRGFPGEKQPASVERIYAARGADEEEGPTSDTPATLPTWLESIDRDHLSRIDRLDVEMDYGMHSYVYQFQPSMASGRLLIFQAGHGACTFPRTDPHEAMSLVRENERGSFLRFFVEPVIAGINYGQSQFGYGDVNMVGISGGGYTTHLCAAIDARIKLSLPTAGSLPLYLRSGSCVNGSGSEGDPEQSWGPLFEERASWLDIYLLGGFGQGRGQVHILNQYNSCCVGGVNYRTFEPYVTDAVQKLDKGFYKVFLDSSHKNHKISEAVVVNVIDRHLSGQANGVR